MHNFSFSNYRILSRRLIIIEHREEIRNFCDAIDPVLVEHGGGFRDIQVNVLETRGGQMLITHLIVDTRDAIGANAVNSMAEALAPELERWTGGRINLRILSNLADRRLARARGVWKLEDIGGKQVRDDILSAFWFAEADPYRAATHNKGIMNGIAAVALATETIHALWKLVLMLMRRGQDSTPDLVAGIVLLQEIWWGL